MLPVAAFLGAASYLHAVDVAGDLLVDLRAADYTSGGANWTNNGTLGGSFNSSNTTIKRFDAYGAPAIAFSGVNDYFSGPASPASVTGTEDHSVEVWVFNTRTKGEEAMVSWGRRGGGDGTNVSFNYGDNGAWGAVGHWGAPDIGWDPNTNNSADGTAVVPALGQWHLLTYVYESASTTTKVYADGVLANQETIGININPGNIFRVGTQNAADGNAENAAWFSGLVGQVRIHSGALTGTQVANNFALESVNYSAPISLPTGLASGPVHRYSFDNAAGATPDGTIVADSISGANAVIRGANAVATGSGINLPGGSSATEAYIDLPNGIVSSKPAISIEIWATVEGNQNWSRILDVGTTNIGEVVGAGGGFSGDPAAGGEYFMLSANTGGDPNMQMEINAPGMVITNGGGNTRVVPGNKLGQETHWVITYENGEWRRYENGKLVDSIPTTDGPTSLNDVNVWLGRSNWSGDNNLDGTFNEVRIFDRALSPNEIMFEYLTGPDTLTIVPEPSIAALLGMAGLAVTRRRRRA